MTQDIDTLSNNIINTSLTLLESYKKEERYLRYELKRLELNLRQIIYDPDYIDIDKVLENRNFYLEKKKRHDEIIQQILKLNFDIYSTQKLTIIN